MALLLTHLIALVIPPSWPPKHWSMLKITTEPYPLVTDTWELIACKSIGVTGEPTYTTMCHQRPAPERPYDRLPSADFAVR